MRLCVMVFVVAMAFAGAGIATHYLQELFTFEVAPAPDYSSEAYRRRLMRGIRAQLENPSGNGNLSAEQVDGLRLRLIELEKEDAGR